MDYFSVTQTAFVSATCMTFVLLILLIRQSFSISWVWPFIIGYGFQFVWLSSISLSYSQPYSSSSYSLLLEAGHYLAWFITLVILLNHRSPFLQWPLITQLNASFILLITLIGITLVVFSNGNSARISACFAITAALLLIFTEQTMKNLGSVRLIKLIGLCLLGQFVFDAYLYGQVTFGYSLGLGLWQTRAAIAFVTTLAVSLGTLLFNDHNDHQHVTVSRPVVFYTTSAVLTLIVFAILSLGAFYVRKLNGYIGSYLFSLSLISSLLLISALTFSRRLKSMVEVFISKHFFSLKYDYRDQWLKTIATTAKFRPSQPIYYQKILHFVCQTFNANQGILWLNQNGKIEPFAGHSSGIELPSFDMSDAFIEPMLTEGWIYSPLSENGKIAQYNQLLPPWFKQQSLWMLCPMLCQGKFIGLLAISQPLRSAQVTFEDRDLMTNLVDQISSQILLHQQESVISANKQMETYNRLSAFIMHDVNNVIAQLALIVRNAEKHKQNPAFIDDMVKTVNNSVDRMQALVQKFKPEAAEAPEKINILELLKELRLTCSDRKPQPSLAIETIFDFTADRQKFSLALKNLIRNAQEATPEDGRITLSTSMDSATGRKKLVIADTGKGMDQEFINSELFRPFSTTKQENGVGIGAHLTRSYIEHIGARLEVESTVNVGTKFTVLF